MVARSLATTGVPDIRRGPVVEREPGLHTRIHLLLTGPCRPTPARSPLAIGSSWTELDAVSDPPERAADPADGGVSPEDARDPRFTREELLRHRLGERFLQPGHPPTRRSGAFLRFRSALGGVHSRLHRRYLLDDDDWTVEEGSALDESYIGPLGTLDVVHSWSVLHHTGQMWRGIEIAQRAVAPDGLLFIRHLQRHGARERTVEALEEDLLFASPVGTHTMRDCHHSSGRRAQGRAR